MQDTHAIQHRIGSTERALESAPRPTMTTQHMSRRIRAYRREQPRPERQASAFDPARD